MKFETVLGSSLLKNCFSDPPILKIRKKCKFDFFKFPRSPVFRTFQNIFSQIKKADGGMSEGVLLLS